MRRVPKHIEVVPLAKGDWQLKLSMWARSPKGRAVLRKASNQVKKAVQQLERDFAPPEDDSLGRVRADSRKSRPAQRMTLTEAIRKLLHAARTAAPLSQLETIEEQAEETLEKLGAFLRRNRKDSIERQQVKVLAAHLKAALEGKVLPSGSIKKLKPTASSLGAAHPWEAAGRKTGNLDQNTICKMTADLLREEAVEALSNLTAKAKSKRISPNRNEEGHLIITSPETLLKALKLREEIIAINKVTTTLIHECKKAGIDERFDPNAKNISEEVRKNPKELAIVEKAFYETRLSVHAAELRRKNLSLADHKAVRELHKREKQLEKLIAKLQVHTVDSRPLKQREAEAWGAPAPNDGGIHP